MLGTKLPHRLLVGVPVAFLLLEGVAAVLVQTPGPGPTRGIALLLGLGAMAVVLALRHNSPLRALVAVLALTLVIGFGPIVMPAALLSLFTVAEYCERREVVGAALASAGVVVIAPGLHGPGLETLSQVLSRLVALGMAVAVGLYLRTRAEYLIGLQERAERLEREQQLLAEHAVADERLRIARELHDVVAHNVSLMVVQAQAAAATRPPEHPGQPALGKIADLGREAMSEMHRMLDVLRLDTSPRCDPELAPQPAVRDIAGLIERTRGAGLEVALQIGELPADLPPAIELSAYRIVQEALTNVVRHAGAEQATVTLVLTAGGLEVVVEDDGCGAEPHRGGTAGHGIIGMRERAALFGGTLEAAPRPDRTGFRVHATLPTR